MRSRTALLRIKTSLLLPHWPWEAPVVAITLREKSLLSRISTTTIIGVIIRRRQKSLRPDPRRSSLKLSLKSSDRKKTSVLVRKDRKCLHWHNLILSVRTRNHLSNRRTSRTLQPRPHLTPTNPQLPLVATVPSAEQVKQSESRPWKLRIFKANRLLNWIKIKNWEEITSKLALLMSILIKKIPRLRLSAGGSRLKAR